jgi:hypothetical protein
MIRNTFLLLVLITVGWFGSFYYRRYEISELQKKVHSQIATLRTYEEGYALRHGAYLVLPDSCKAPSDLGWSQLGLPAPAKSKGCFKVEPLSASFPTEITASSSPVTAASIKIIGISPGGQVTGVESSEDKAPRWLNASGLPLDK